jgi:hypothetical protein
VYHDLTFLDLRGGRRENVRLFEILPHQEDQGRPRKNSVCCAPRKYYARRSNVR